MYFNIDFSWKKNAFYDDDGPFLSELGDRMSHIMKLYTIAFGTFELTKNSKIMISPSIDAYDHKWDTFQIPRYLNLQKNYRII